MPLVLSLSKCDMFCRAQLQVCSFHRELNVLQTQQTVKRVSFCSRVRMRRRFCWPASRVSDPYSSLGEFQGSARNSGIPASASRESQAAGRQVRVAPRATRAPPKLSGGSAVKVRPRSEAKIFYRRNSMTDRYAFAGCAKSRQEHQVEDCAMHQLHAVA
ncbi:hypothetical protein IE81DRAFT_64240 [Ceraceosorus guamensis]|uniref:Uncharacterized protein n=1 Tax=Ceraceosorus guamensis TaxID=1522189 RepID=A0A316VMW2_9BASI|nr:hypothetical protein IE81DRAFT_64240 [Ceraceosorus guamensis]PWN38897.1 hypothetical protein IE81DRAFT_64240 [Ceraceosorus guamensis]